MFRKLSRNPRVFRQAGGERSSLGRTGCLPGRLTSTTTGNPSVVGVVYYYRSLPSPCGKKFRSKPQIARFLGDHADLTCFDFSRAGSLGDGTRRRARDRNPQGTSKRFDPRQVLPQQIRPLSLNPLRPSGPVRRTCGVIKLPIMLLSPPAGNIELRDSILGQNGGNTVGGGAETKTHTLNVVVQSLWERRLNTMNPNDHLSGKELSRSEQQTVPPPGYTDMASNRGVPLLIPTSLQPQQPVLPSLLGTNVQRTLPQVTQSNKIVSSNHQVHNNVPLLTGTKLLQLHQQQQVKTHNTNAVRIGGGGAVGGALPLTVTDSDVKLQEQRVQLLRQQLMAAQSSL